MSLDDSGSEYQWYQDPSLIYFSYSFTLNTRSLDTTNKNLYTNATTT